MLDPVLQKQNNIYITQSTPVNPELRGIRTNHFVPLSQIKCIILRSIRTQCSLVSGRFYLVPSVSGLTGVDCIGSHQLGVRKSHKRRINVPFSLLIVLPPPPPHEWWYMQVTINQNHNKYTQILKYTREHLLIYITELVMHIYIIIYCKYT